MNRLVCWSFWVSNCLKLAFLCNLKMQYPWIRKILLSCFRDLWSLEITISTAKAPTTALTQSRRVVSRCRRGRNRPRGKQVVIMLGSVPLLLENCSKFREKWIWQLNHSSLLAMRLSDMSAEASSPPLFSTAPTKSQAYPCCKTHKHGFWLSQTSNRKTSFWNFVPIWQSLQGYQLNSTANYCCRSITC